MSSTGYDFDFSHPYIDKGLRSILHGTHADVSILFDGLENERQLFFLSAQGAPNVPSAEQESSTQGQETPQADTRATRGDDHERAANEIHAFGSYTKNVIAYAFIRLADRRGDPSILKIPAEDLVNFMRRERDPQARFIKMPVESSVQDLILHRNALPPVNKIMFAPDGKFLFTKDDVLNIDPQFITTYFDGEESIYTYSNGNYILLAIVLELSTGKSLAAALKDLVFDDLGMNDSFIDLQGLTKSGKEDRLVQGYQLSADGRPIKVNSKNLLNDSAESGAMGLRSTLNDIAKFNLALLQTIRTEPSTGLDTEDPLRIFFGQQISFGGLVSLPAEGDFQSETPIIHLKAPGYKPNSLGKLSTKLRPSKRIRAVSRRWFMPSKKDMTEVFTHKAGYIDGHSCIVIVFEDHRDFLIIVSNATGPSDVVHHVSRFLLQEILDLSPKIGPPGEDSRRETKARSQALADLERSNLLGTHNVDIPGPELRGIYRHQYCAQEIVIQDDGVVIFQTSSGAKKSSPMRMAFEGANTNIIRLFIDADCLPLEAWSVWADLTFHVVTDPGRVGLSHEGGKDMYWKRLS